MNFISKSSDCGVVTLSAIVNDNDCCGEKKLLRLPFPMPRQPSASPAASLPRADKALADAQGESHIRFLG